MGPQVTGICLQVEMTEVPDTSALCTDSGEARFSEGSHYLVLPARLGIKLSSSHWLVSLCSPFLTWNCQLFQ